MTAHKCPKCGKMDFQEAGTETAICLSCGYWENSLGESGITPKKVKFQMCDECKKRWSGYYKEWRTVNKDRYQAQRREYNRTHKDKINEYARRHRAKVKEMKLHERQNPVGNKK